MSTIVRFVLCGVVGMVLVPSSVAGQAPPPQQQETELVFQREVFRYPQFERRNPFRPLGVGDAGAVRFEQLRLAGIIYSADPLESVAIVTTAELTVSDGGAGVTVTDGQAWSAKVGQTVGNVRFLEIGQNQVLVEVEEFGIVEQKIMQLQIRRLGGTP